MTDREFADILRIKALQLLEDNAGRLRLHRNNEVGSMAAHVARNELIKLRQLATKLIALADAAETI